MSGRVLHVVKVAGVSGAENHLLLLLPGLRDHGWDVEAVMLHEGEPGAEEFAARLEADAVVAQPGQQQQQVVLGAGDPGDLDDVEDAAAHRASVLRRPRGTRTTPFRGPLRSPTHRASLGALKSGRPAN